MYDLEIFIGLLIGSFLVILFLVFFYVVLAEFGTGTDSTNRRRNINKPKMGDSSRTQGCYQGSCPKDNPNLIVLNNGRKAFRKK